MHFLNRLKNLKLILVSFFIISITFFLFFLQLPSIQETLKPNKTNRFVLNTTSLKNDFNLETPILCNYTINSSTNEVFQDCTNLIESKEFYLLIEVDISGHFKLSDILFYTQDGDLINDAKIISFSRIPYTLLDNYSRECSNYCYPSRLFFQIRLFNNKQIKGFKLTGFRFRNKLRPSALTNYDPSKLKVKVVKIQERVFDYDALRSKINNADKTNVWFDRDVSTPISANQGINSENLRGLDVDVDFFRTDNRIEKTTFNLQNHSLTTEDCASGLKKDLIGSLDVNSVCDYLVYQRSLANQFGDASFVIDLNKLNTVTNTIPSLDITLTSQQFFEKMLFSYRKISFNSLSTSILTKDQWSIFSIFHLSPTNNVLESLDLRFKDLTEEFLEDLFSLPQIKDLDTLDLSNNNISLSSKTSSILERIKIKNLYLNDNTLEDSFSFRSSMPTLESLNVRNTNWGQVKTADLWKNIPNIKELFLAGTKINELTLDQFVALLPNPRNIIAFEANFSDVESLDIEKFNISFPSIQRLNVPLTHYTIDDLNKFVTNSQSFSGKIGLPPNGTDFENSTPYEIFQASNKLENKIVDFQNNDLSLYYDLYIGSLFRKYLATKEFFNEDYVMENLQKTIDNIVYSYSTLFESANLDESTLSSFSKKHQNVLDSFESAALLLESKMTGEFLTNYINENNEIVNELHLNHAPTNDDINFIVAISILIILMLLSLSSIVLLLLFKF